MTALDHGRCLARLTEARVGRLATVTVDSAPHVVPCCFAVVDRVSIGTGDRSSVLYSAVDGKPKSTMALRRLDNIGANPAASLLVDHYDDDWRQLWWVRADGPAAVVGSAEERELALTALAEKYRQYRDQPPEGAVLRIVVETLTGWSFA